VDLNKSYISYDRIYQYLHDETILALTTGTNKRNTVITGMLLGSIPDRGRGFFKSQSHISTDGQSASLSSCRAPPGTHDQMLSLRSDRYSVREDFSSSPCVQTGSEAHPASYPMGTEGVKCGRGVTLTTHPHLVAEVKYE
jgi:hypothetical protein